MLHLCNRGSCEVLSLVLAFVPIMTQKFWNGEKTPHLFQKKRNLVSEIKFSSYHALLTEIVSTGMFFLSMTWDLCAPRVFSSSSDCLEALLCLPAFFWDHQLHISLVFGYQSSAKTPNFPFYFGSHRRLFTVKCLRQRVLGYYKTGEKQKTHFIQGQVDQICGLLSPFPGEICPLIRVGVCLLQDSFMLFRANGMTLCISNELKEEYQRFPNALDELPLESSHYPFHTSRVLMYRGLTQRSSVRSSIYDIESASKQDTEWSFLKINVKKKKATKPYFFETRAMKKHPLLCKGPVFSVFCVISISAFAISLKFPSGHKVVA